MQWVASIIVWNIWNLYDMKMNLQNIHLTFIFKFEEAYYWEPSQTSIMNSFGFAGKIVKQSKAKMFDWV